MVLVATPHPPAPLPEGEGSPYGREARKSPYGSMEMDGAHADLVRVSAENMGVNAFFWDAVFPRRHLRQPVSPPLRLPVWVLRE